MTTRVEIEQEVFINDTRYRLVEGGGVTSALNSIPIPKFVTGDYNKDTHPNISVQTWDDQRGGMGIDRWSLEHNDRCWETGLDIHHVKHLTLAESGFNVAAMTDGIPLISELDGSMVSANGTDVQSFAAPITWTSRRTLDAAPTDVMNGNLDGTEYLIFAIGTGYEYSSAIATWAQSTKDALNIAFWHERFWGIDATGQLWYTYTMGSLEVNDARLLLDHSEVVTGLFQARGPNQEFILYVVTSRGLYAHDIGNRRFVPIVGIVLPNNNAATHERPAVVWRERIYLAAGRGVIEYDPVSSTIRDIGFDLDDGLPDSRDGVIQCLASSSRELFVGTRPSDSVALVMGWDGRGWRKIRHEAIGNIESMHVAEKALSAQGQAPHLWFATQSSGPLHRVGLVELNSSAAQPRNLTAWDYGSGGADYSHIFSWFDAGQSDVTKIALRLKVEVEQAAAGSATVTVFVAFDNGAASQLTNTHTSDSTFNASNDNIDGNGITTFIFPDKNAATGTAFRSMQITLQFGLDSGTASADVISVTLEYFKVLDPKWAFDFDLDLSGNYSNLSPQAARANLVTAAETAALVEFTFRDDSGNTRNYYVNVKQIQGMEESGHREEGVVHIRCEEP